MFDLDRLLGIIVDGRYRLTRQIGRGSFGVVFAAEEYVLGHAVSQVAVKLILAEEEWERDSFLREIRGLATLAHPQIIAYRVAGEEEDGLLGGTLFLVTELAERSLADAVRAAGTLPDQDARRVAADMAAALAYVHAREVIHRDVKPANVLQVGERWKLSDFGLVRAAQGAMVRGTGMAGTPAYLAPEAAFHQQYGPATDLYALGVTLLECLTGHVAHEGHNRQEILNNLAVHPPSIPPDLPGPWKTLLHRCLERDPLARPRAEEIPELLGVSTPRTPDARPEPAGDVAVAGPGRDGAAMVRVPAGMFLMGFADGREDERPEHQVTLPAFDIDRAPVTNALYARFLNDAGRLKDDGGHDYLFLNESLQLECVRGEWRARPGWEQHPVVCVSYFGALAYARWAGKRLPTEAEWEKAARGSDGRLYPWGSLWDADRCQSGADRHGLERTAPVDRFPEGASPYGPVHMAGNVWEWTGSLYRPYAYQPEDGRENPDAPGLRVMRGGSWCSDRSALRVTYRQPTHPQMRGYANGFRCARSVGSNQ